VFHIEDGIKLTRSGLALDFRRRQRRAFVSHAHFDHMARHELALCTPATAALYQHRLGKRQVMELPYHTQTRFGDVTLTTYPAGHCLGSAMLLANDGRQRLLYTGDFKLSSSATAEAAVVPEADILITECTFGHPRYRLPPREQAIAELIDLTRRTLTRGDTPVFHLYELGKAQEVTRLLADHGIGVLQHPQIYATSRVYESLGANLAHVRCYDAKPLDGCAVITLPRRQCGFRLAGIERPYSIGVTGWALDATTCHRLQVDHAIALSDHADFDELNEMVQRVAARKVYCTHGPASFAAHLRAAGWDAQMISA